MADNHLNDDGFSTVNGSVAGMDHDDDQTELDLTGYTEDEILHINEVMAKDKTLRAEERQRGRKIDENTEMSIGTIQLNNVDSGDKFCLVCGEKFSMIMTPKKICSLCEKGVCSSCVHKFYNNNILLCSPCFLSSKRDGQTGTWFKSISKFNGRFRRSATLIVMSSIRRFKLNFGQSYDRRSMTLPEQIKDEGNADIRKPIYVAKRDSPRRPQSTYVEKEAHQISAETTPSIPTAIDSTDNGIHAKNNSQNRLHSNQSNLAAMSSISSSMMSVYSETDESYKSGILVSGDIYIAITYDEGAKSLVIHVDQCRNIAVADRHKRRTDPYVKSYLLPDRTKVGKKKTTVKKMTVNPVFNEKLTYYITKTELASRTLSVAVWHKSSIFKYNIFLGEVQLILSDLDLKTKEFNWFTFQDKRKYPMRSAGLLFKGELIFKLKYKPSTRKDSKGALHVCIVGAKNLVSDKPGVNAYVKGYLLPEKDARSKKKTTVCKDSLNPCWGSLLIFPEVTIQELRDRSLELSVCHQKKLKANEFLGGIRLNLGLGLHSTEHVQWMDAQGSEKEAWEVFLSNPNEYVEFSINLRPNLDF